MNRDKVLELAREGGLVHQWQTDGEKHDILKKLERFAPLVEREVRGDVEPVAWMYEWDGKKHLTFTDQRPIEQSHPHFNKSAPLYTHPAPAASAESVASVHIKDGCLVGSHRKSGADFPDGQYALYPIGTFPTPAVDAEPVAYETDTELWSADDPGINNWIRKNGRPLYRHPAPAVVRQLVDGLAGLIDFIEIDNLKIDKDALRIAKAALAAVKDNGL